VTEFNSASLSALAEERGLVYKPDVLSAVVAALDAGKHVMLTGAPGTGKTSLAYLIAELAQATRLSIDYVAVTASSEWGVSDTVGRYVQAQDGPAFQPGIVLQAVESRAWMVFDELNRTDFDKAFGPLLTVLAGQAVTLPYKHPGHKHPISIVPPGGEVPKNTEPIRISRHWRMIATMNEFDKETLYRLSYALMRRFAFIEVEAPADDTFHELVEGPGGIVAQLLPVRHFVDLGPAIFVDAATYASRRADDPGVRPSRVLFEVFYSFFLPQLDQLNDEQAAELFDMIAPLFDAPELNELRRAVRKALGGTHQRLAEPAKAAKVAKSVKKVAKRPAPSAAAPRTAKSNGHARVR
jgi:energy-coupling factor transporter ATP-binding protein EcfA2